MLPLTRCRSLYFSWTVSNVSLCLHLEAWALTDSSRNYNKYCRNRSNAFLGAHCKTECFLAEKQTELKKTPKNQIKTNQKAWNSSIQWCSSDKDTHQALPIPILAGFRLWPQDMLPLPSPSLWGFSPSQLLPGHQEFIKRGPCPTLREVSLPSPPSPVSRPAKPLALGMGSCPKHLQGFSCIFHALTPWQW